MLKAILDNLESVEEGQRGFYREVTDEKSPIKGKFILAVEPVGGLALENVDGLKTALAKERGQRESNDRLLKEFEGLDPADVRKKLEKYETLSQIDPNKEADRLAHEKVEAFKNQAQKDIASIKETSEKREKNLIGQITNLLLTSEAKGALAKHEGNIDLLLPHVEKRSRVRETDDGQFVVEVVDDNGIARIKDASGALMTIEDLVIEMRAHETFGTAFKNSGTSGGGSQTNGSGGRPTEKNPWTQEHFNLTQQAMITKDNPQLAARLKQAAGAA